MAKHFVWRYFEHDSASCVAKCLVQKDDGTECGMTVKFYELQQAKAAGRSKGTSVRFI